MLARQVFISLESFRWFGHGQMSVENNFYVRCIAKSVTICAFNDKCRFGFNREDTRNDEIFCIIVDKVFVYTQYIKCRQVLLLLLLSCVYYLKLFWRGNDNFITLTVFNSQRDYELFDTAACNFWKIWIRVVFIVSVTKRNLNNEVFSNRKHYYFFYIYYLWKNYIIRVIVKNLGNCRNVIKPKLKRP